MQRLSISLGINILALMLVAAAPCNAQDKPIAPDAIEAKTLKFQNIVASRPGDQRAYLLLGSGFFRGLRFGDPDAFISAWLIAHPTARATPISRMLSTNRRTLKPYEMVYIWVEDGEHNLNQDMVRAGMFLAGNMFDMVDNQAGLDRLLQDPKMAATRASIEKDRAAFPQDRTDRLIGEDAYKAEINRIQAAENEAHAEKLGIWSDAMEAEREAEGFQ